MKPRPIYKKMEQPKNFITSNLRLLMVINGVESKVLAASIGENHATVCNWKAGVSVPPIQKSKKYVPISISQSMIL